MVNEQFPEMKAEKIFQTKTGYCHVQADQIVLTRDGLIGQAGEVAVGNSVLRILGIYVLITIGLFYFAFDAWQNESYTRAILFAVLGLFLIFTIIKSRNHSAAHVIDRKRIKDMKLKRGISGLTRSRFEVVFVNEAGKIKKRLIMLPGSLNEGKEAMDKAVEIFTEAGLLK